jgi:hypothetical protein
VVGAKEDNLGANVNQGSAYVFVEPLGGWTGALNEAAQLTASDGEANDQFGLSVAIAGATVVVGVPFDDGASLSQGSAYVFVEPPGGWAGALTEDAKLTASDAEASDVLGFSVAIGEGTVVAGTTGDDLGANMNQGSAYVFVEPPGGWAGDLFEAGKLSASDGAGADNFGVSVAISGDTVVAGAPDDDIGANLNQGSAYVFGQASGVAIPTLSPAGLGALALLFLATALWTLKRRRASPTPAPTPPSDRCGRRAGP